MRDLRQVEHDILAIGKVDSHELEVLRRELYAAGKVDRGGADFLVELHKRVQHRTPAFDQSFYQPIKDHILAHGRIDAEEAAWLRRMLFADGTIEDEERMYPGDVLFCGAFTGNTGWTPVVIVGGRSWQAMTECESP